MRRSWPSRATPRASTRPSAFIKPAGRASSIELKPASGTARTRPNPIDFQGEVITRACARATNPGNMSFKATSMPGKAIPKASSVPKIAFTSAMSILQVKASDLPVGLMCLQRGGWICCTSHRVFRRAHRGNNYPACSCAGLPTRAVSLARQHEHVEHPWPWVPC